MFYSDSNEVLALLVSEANFALIVTQEIMCQATH